MTRRARHHTNDERLASIRRDMAINPSRGDPYIGVDVELEPFGTPKPGRNGPQAEMGCHLEGAYVEFDLPTGAILTNVGPRRTAKIPTTEPLSLLDKNPVFVKVRRCFWEFWRTKPEP